MRYRARNLPLEVQHVAVTVSIALSICRLRATWTGGRRLQQRAVRFSRGFPTPPWEAFQLPGAANILHTLELARFVQVQGKWISGRWNIKNKGLSFVYMMGSRAPYIGQGVCIRTGACSGVSGRFREHLRGLYRISMGLPTPDTARYRKLLLGSAEGLFFLY